MKREDSQMKRIAVFTGASSGMGREFVLRITSEEKFDEVWLIARRTDRLKEVAEDVGTECRLLPYDLLDPRSVESYRGLLEAEKPDVAVLVNAAGFGLFGRTEEMDAARQLDIIELNSRALAAMTLATLPFMHEGGRIYELGSLSSFQPVPYINVYGASKAFVLSFSRALNCELKHEGRGIRVMAVCPGWVTTEFFDHAVSDDTISYYNRYYTPGQVVERALRDMKRGRDVSVCGFQVRAQVLLTKLLPHRWVMAIWCRQQKK